MTTRQQVAALYGRGLLDLVYEAAGVHRRYHDPETVQCASLLSVKTGGCPEDCAYCPQSAHYDTGVESSALMRVGDVVTAAERAKAGGADRFCMGAAWRQASDGPEFDRVIEMVRAVKGFGLETCVTLGMIDAGQAGRLRDAGLDYYNHNLDSGPDFYETIITTRSYEDRLETLRHVREAGIKVCCGGILGMGEDDDDRIDLLVELARQQPQPESVPINTLVTVEGTPLAEQSAVRLGHRRSCHRHRPHLDAPGEGPLERGADGDGRGDAGALLSRRCQLDFPRRPAPDDAEPRTG